MFEGMCRAFSELLPRSCSTLVLPTRRYLLVMVTLVFHVPVCVGGSWDRFWPWDRKLPSVHNRPLPIDAIEIGHNMGQDIQSRSTLQSTRQRMWPCVHDTGSQRPDIGRSVLSIFRIIRWNVCTCHERTQRCKESSLIGKSPIRRSWRVSLTLLIIVHPSLSIWASLEGDM